MLEYCPAARYPKRGDHALPLIMLRVIFRGCLWKIDVGVLPTFAAEVEGVGGQPSVLRTYAAHCIKLVCMVVVPQRSLF